MTPDNLRHWQSEMGLTYDSAARALGVGRRTYAGWVAGTAKIPGPVGLACAALVERPAHPAPLYSFELFDVRKEVDGSWTGRMRFFDSAGNETTDQSTTVLGRATEQRLRKDAEAIGRALVKEWSENALRLRRRREDHRRDS